MAWMPSTERLAAIGLATAGLTIVGLAALVVSDLKREAELHREVIAVQQAQDGLEVLRVQLNELLAAARLGAATGEAKTFAGLDQRAAEIDARLDRLRASDDVTVPELDALVPMVRLLIVHARSVAPARMRGLEAGGAAAQATEGAASDAGAALERSIAALTARVNDGSFARIRVGESLRRWVAWFVAGSLLALALLFLAFRHVLARERAARRRIEWLAHFDPVTGLPNRALLSDRLAQEVARARRLEERFAVLLFDLDGFKDVNDTWGHAAGDRVLAMVAERSRRCMRASDTVGRLGGDEFLAILPQTEAPGALALAQKLLAALTVPYALGTQAAHVGVSIGVSIFPDHGDDAETLQRAADAALYAAKRGGKGRAQIGAAVPRRTQETVS
jgi:diguanylate cyclase (GGDEF)-like protein